MEYLYPPLIDVTNKPKEEVIEYCRIKTAEKRFENKNIDKTEFDACVYRAKNKIQEPTIVVAVLEEPEEEQKYLKDKK